MNRMVLESVSYAYSSGSPLFADVTLGLAADEIVAVTGPNGCGKTTLLRLMAGDLTPTAGRVAWNDRPVDDMHQHIAYVPAEFDLFDYLTPAENARFVLEFLARPWKPDAYARLAERFGLAPFDERRCRALSRGTRKKVQLITGLLAEPDVFLADEPFDGLDADSVVALTDELARFAGGGGLAVVAAHDAVFARTVARTSLVITPSSPGAARVGVEARPIAPRLAGVG